MSMLRVFIHAVWATSERKPLLQKSNKDLMCTHVRANAVKKGIHLLNVNGDKDHLHALLSMKSTQSLDTILNLLKGESSYWANKQLIWPEKFYWQDGYFAVSVSPSHLAQVSAYIDNQEAHHKKISFQEEYDRFVTAMKKFGYLPPSDSDDSF